MQKRKNDNERSIVMPAKDYEIRKRIYVPQPDGTKKPKLIYAHNEEEFLFKTKRALAQAQEIIENSKNPKFNDIADEWNEKHESEIAHYTYDSYQRPLKDLKEEFEGKTIKEITPLDLQRFITNYAHKGYAKQTIKLRKIVATQIFDFAILKGCINSNPALAVKVPKSAPKTERELPSDVNINIVKQSVDKEFGLFAYLVLFTGCRKGEALALRYEDIDFKNNKINIDKVLIFKTSCKSEIRHRTKSKSGTRIIPLLIPLKNVLPHKTGYIFNQNGSPLTKAQFDTAWRHYIKATGVELTPHQLRHAFATICYDAEIGVKDAAALLGHSKVELTLDIYTHIKESRNTVNERKLNEYLAK